jgi:hypothetical protein
VEKSTRRILCLAHDKGRRHDFRLFKTSKVHLHPETKAVVDSGYQGLQRAHANTAIPKKRSKKNPLSATRPETALSPANAQLAGREDPDVADEMRQILSAARERKFETIPMKTALFG